MRVITVTGAGLMAAIYLATAVSAQAQLEAVDDTFSVPFGEALVVETPGVLENDTYNGEPAEDAGAEAALVSGPTYGVLSCETEPAFELCPDGSFTYAPDSSFPGFDTFTYEVTVGTEVAEATVTLTACSGGPPMWTCWKEAPYLAKLGELGYSNLQEGFEDDAAWGLMREPKSALSVVSQGIAWETNHTYDPALNEITTGDGPARTGLWGVYDSDHGYATATPAACKDVVTPDCLYKDGFTGTWQSGESTLYGVGGHFTGSQGPKLVMILDGGAPIGLGLVPVGEPTFFGVIDMAGFTTFRVEETDGKVGQERLVFGDDFTFGTTPADTTPPQVSLVGSSADTGDGELAEGEVTAVPITQLLVSYDELVWEEGEDSVTYPANYLLFLDGGDGFDTVDCATGVDPGDVAVPVDGVTYTSGSERLAVVDINGGLAVPAGAYRFLVCGTTSIRDWAGNPLDGDGNGTGGDDFQRNFTVTGVVGCSVDADCDDALFCTGTETCVAGLCQPGTAVDCTDGVSCTVDSCNETTDSCDNTPNDGLCDNGLFCDGAETCDVTLDCQAGTPPAIDDAVGCTDDSCDEANDVIINTPNDALCDNGQFCDGAETCDAVSDCQGGTAPVVDDTVDCTDDSCDEVNDVIVHTPNDALCDNGLFCDGAETCDAVSDCQGGTAPVVDDTVGCTDDSCDEVNDVIVHTPNDALCDNGLFCDGAETCDAVSDCQGGTAPVVDDTVGCTDDSCDEANDVIVHTPNDALCDNGQFCDGAETCDAVSDCQGGTAPVVDDTVGCTDDSCDEANDVIVHTPNDALCDNGQFCDGAETCDAVSDCQGGTAPVVDDTVGCTDDSCDEANDVIVHTPNDALCDNGQFCDGAETCDAVSDCQGGTAPVVDDTVGCTDDSCDEANDVIVHTPNDTLCDNGLFCDGAETCDAVNDCQAGSDPCPGLACDEAGDSCTACSADTDCDDALFCNGDEVCDAGNCQSGTPPSIDDGVVCTDDSCDEVNDVIVNTPNNALCDNGQFCDGAETCDAVSDCQAGAPPSTDDGVACTDDSCDDVNDVIINTPNDALCDNGQFCDGAETCDAVSDCQAGTPPSTDDGVACTDDSCDDVNDVIVNTPNDALCDNGQFCDGAENCDAVSDCQPGSDPCPGQVCDEVGDECTVCQVNADCDDALFCNGAEECKDGVCQAGTPPSIDDGVACTDDSCDDVNDVIVNTPNDANCPDDGLFCNGTDSCDPVLDCLSTGDPCPEGEFCNEADDVCDGANEPPEIVGVTPSTQSVQYSDAIEAVVVTAFDSGSTQLSIGAVGVPPDLSFGPPVCTTTESGIECSFTLEGQLLAEAGTYEVTVTVSDGLLESDPETFSIVVEPEDAGTAFDDGNPASVEVEEPGGDSGPFSLAVQVTELEDPRDVLGDRNLAGDIGLVEVTMTLDPVGPGTSTTGVCSHSDIDPGDLDPESDFDYDTLTVVCDFDNVEENSYLVTVGVDGGFYSGSGEDIFAVVDPSLGFTAGGGWFYWPGTEDPVNNYPGDRTKVAFTVKDDKQGGDPIGHLVLISGLGRGAWGSGSSSNLRLQASSFAALSLGESTDGGGAFDWATFGGEGTLNGPGVPTDMEVIFLVYLEDRGRRRQGLDRFWLEVLDTQGKLVPELSMGRPATAYAVTLEGGNLTAHQRVKALLATGDSKEGGRSSATTTSVPVLGFSFF